MINEKFIRHVADYMSEFLPRPNLKPGEDRAESLSELGIIKEGYRVC
ncbi:MAG: hypothetical protein IJP99_08520 [Methanobrevibacter sp.]|nr:hypothetical protein [Methanobrevibacter sp.]